MRGIAIDQLILRRAARSAHVLHSTDFRSMGISPAASANRVSSGLLGLILPRTWGVGPSCSDPTFEMLSMAAVLSGGAGTYVDGSTAATLLGAWDRGHGEIHATIPGKSHRPAPDPFYFHRADRLWVPHQPLDAGPIPTTGFVTMCCQFAVQHTKWQLASVIQRAVYLGLGSVAQLECATLGQHGMRWSRVLREAVQLVRQGSVGTRSWSEDKLLNALLVAGQHEPIVNTRGAMGMYRDEPDFVWASPRVNIEVDGGHHDEPSQAADDAARDAEAALLGWRVLRIRTRDLWRAPDRVLPDVLCFLGGSDVPLHTGTRRLYVT